MLIEKNARYVRSGRNPDGKSETFSWRVHDRPENGDNRDYRRRIGRRLASGMERTDFQPATFLRKQDAAKEDHGQAGGLMRTEFKEK